MGARQVSQSTNEADIAAVTETIRAYYDGMIAGDEARLARAFHPRACIAGNAQGELYWATLDEFVADCKKDVAQAGPHERRIDGLSVEGDTALVRPGGQYAGVWYSDDLSFLWIDDTWRIVHKTFYPHPGA
jgi:Putative lumazine-binding